MESIVKTYATAIKQLEGDTRQMHFLISTDSVDRDNDILDPKGWQLDRYKTNPIIAWAHDYKSLPVAKCVSIAQTPKGLEATAEFPAKGIYPFADTVYDMLKGGFLNATSVGFTPIDYEQAHDRKGFNFKKQELTEFSIVPIPANPDALVQQRAVGLPDAQVRSWCKAITDWASAQQPAALKALDEWKARAGVTLSGTEVELAEFEKDYLIESEEGTKPLSDVRIAKLATMNGVLKAAKNTKAAGHIMDAYANAHHAQTVMAGMCNAGDSEKAVSGGHKAQVKEAHDAIGRAKEHARAAADCMGEQADDETAEKMLLAQGIKLHAESFLSLIDDPNALTIKDGLMQDVLNTLGPELAELIAGQTTRTLNQMLGRID